MLCEHHACATILYCYYLCVLVSLQSVFLLPRLLSVMVMMFMSMLSISGRTISLHWSRSVIILLSSLCGFVPAHQRHIHCLEKCMCISPNCLFCGCLPTCHTVLVMVHTCLLFQRENDYIAYPIDQVRHISYQLCYAVNCECYRCGVAFHRHADISVSSV